MRLVSFDPESGEMIVAAQDVLTGRFALGRMNVQTGAGQLLGPEGQVLQIENFQIAPIRHALPATDATQGLVPVPGSAEVPTLPSGAAGAAPSLPAGPRPPLSLPAAPAALMGGQGAESIIARYPQLAGDLTKARGLQGAAANEAISALVTRAEWIAQAERMSLEDLKALLRRPEFAVGTVSSKDLRYVRYLKQGGTLPYNQWESLAERIWANRGFGTLREKELAAAGLTTATKNSAEMVSMDPKIPNFIPDGVGGNPAALQWGKPYHFEEIKDWANMSDTGNLKAMLDYVDMTNGATLTIYFKSTTYMSGPLRTRIEGMMSSGKVDLVPFIGDH
jgi:hypothetical protein